LALACRSSNLHKGTNQSAYDPESGRLVRLFNPRNDDWHIHFRADDGQVFGLTPEGRATVALLKMNRPGLVELRQSPTAVDE